MRDERDQIGASSVQKLITFGLLFFIAYIYFTDFSTQKQIETKADKPTQVLVINNKIDGSKKRVIVENGMSSTLTVPKNILEQISSLNIESQDEILLFELSLEEMPQRPEEVQE